MKTSLFALFFAVCVPSCVFAMEKPKTQTQPIEIERKDSHDKRTSGSYSGDGSPTTHRLPVTGREDDLATQCAKPKHRRHFSE